MKCENYSTIINIGDRYDNTPLHAAAMKGFSGIVRMLLEYGAKLDPVNDEDLTPLHLSAKNGHVRYCRGRSFSKKIKQSILGLEISIKLSACWKLSDAFSLNIVSFVWLNTVFVATSLKEHLYMSTLLVLELG